MFPLRDSHKTHTFPLITYVIIALNVFVFFLEFNSPDTDVFISKYALIPANIDFSDYMTLVPFLTSQFLHAGFIHIISNMWFLKIFGDNVEEKFGHINFLVFYLLGGTVGGFLQYLLISNSSIPMLGASGAVAAVLGAYLVFFPRHRIETLIPIGFYVSTIEIPSAIMLLYWFITQLFSGVGSIAVSQTGGVAFWAHVGGFAAGWLIATFFSNSKSAEEEILD